MSPVGRWSQPMFKDDESWRSTGEAVHQLAPDGWFMVFVVPCEPPDEEQP